MPDPPDKMSPRQLADLLRSHLRHYVAGSKLPGREVLARRFGVGPRTAAAAVRLLADEGLIKVRPRHEPVVLDKATQLKLRIERIIAVTAPQRRLYEFQQTILRGADRRCQLNGIRFEEYAKLPDLSRSDALEQIAGNKLDRIGWVFVNHIPPDQSLLAWRIQQVPFVLVDDRSRAQPTHSVCFDVRRAIYQATETLILLGHTRIGYLGDLRRKDVIATDRERGFELAHERHGLEISHSRMWQLDGGDHELATQTMLDALAKHRDVTAVVAADIQAGSGVLQACHRMGLPVPGQISVVSGGATPREPPPMMDRLSRFDQGTPEQLGTAAVDLLLETREHPEPVQIMLGAKWLDAGSTGRPEHTHTPDGSAE